LSRVPFVVGSDDERHLLGAAARGAAGHGVVDELDDRADGVVGALPEQWT
jgi:hypothetical protein